MKAGKIGLIVAAVVIVGVVVAAVVISRRTPPEGTAVLVVGDSVTYLARDAIDERFEWTDNVAVRGYSGYRSDELVAPAVASVAQTDPPIVVVMSGYNDLTQGVDTDAAVQQLVDVAASADCGVWVLLPTKGLIDPAKVERFNDRVEELADAAGVHVATGWRDAADDTEDRFPDPALVSDDGIHETDEGAEVIADVMATAVEEECSSVG